MTHETTSKHLTAVGMGLIRTARPHQWYKQGVLVIGIVFSKNATNIAAWSKLLMAVIAYTAVAGAVYTFNDISDREEDRQHPTKQNRPIASGQVPVWIATCFATLLTGAGFLLSWIVTPLLAAILGVYVAQNMIYSMYLKQVVIVDILVVAIGFVLRAIAGVVAIDIWLSPWLVVCTFLLALVLAIGKRRHELEKNENPSEVRTTLDEYTTRNLDQLLVVTMSSLLMAYALYTFNKANPAMMLTLPFAVFGVFRYHYLIHTSDIAGRPEYLFTDQPSVLNLLFWGIVSVAVLYDVTDQLVGLFS